MQKELTLFLLSDIREKMRNDHKRIARECGFRGQTPKANESEIERCRVPYVRLPGLTP